MHCITKNLNSNLFSAVFLLLLFSFRLPVRLLPSSLLDLPHRHRYPAVNIVLSLSLRRSQKKALCFFWVEHFQSQVKLI
jgi:hypothetical protein